MKRLTNRLGPMILILASPAALAQIGVLDQSSPRTNATYNVDVDFLIWQQQIRCGLAGQLEGIRLMLYGDQSDVSVLVRRGAAPSSEPALFQGLVTLPSSGFQEVFVDMTEANIQLAVDDVFDMETVGNNTGTNLVGNYTTPPGDPPYAEPLYLNGQLYADGGWRHGFETFMLTGGTPCPGDLNGDGAVSLSDLTILLSNFGTTGGASYEMGNLDGDGDVDLSDLTLFLANFGTMCP